MAPDEHAEDLTPRPMKRPGGRTEAVRKQVIAATVEILSEDGVPGVTVDAVAERSGVARTTLYRRWRSPAGLMLEALREELGPRASRMVDTGTFRSDLRALLDDVTAFLSSSPGKGIMQVAFIGYESQQATREIQTYWDHRFAAAGTIVERAIERGELERGTPARQIIELAAAPIYFRVFITRDSIDDGYLESLVERVLKASGARRPRRRKSDPEHLAQEA